MNNSSLILLFLLSNLFLLKVNSLKWGENQIDNCIECGQGAESNTCAKCESKHFLLLENLFCIPCDDPINGQIGCKGECNSTKYSNYARNVNKAIII